jgi:hypothetical protein
MACTNATCVNSNCQGVCSPGQLQCVDGTNYNSCDANGQYTVPGACTAAQECIQDHCGCIPGNGRCLSGKVEQCDNNGVWQTTATCSGSTCCNCADGVHAIACVQNCTSYCGGA